MQAKGFIKYVLMAVIFILLLIEVVFTQCSDNIFPKVFGGIHSDVSFQQMDFNEPTLKIAVAAYTSEIDIIGTTCYGLSFIIMYSATTFMREWAKGVSKCGYTFTQIAFSTDGLYVVAQDNYKMISVFSNTGTHIKTTTVNKRYTLNQLARGLLMDSQTTRNIYVVDFQGYLYYPNNSVNYIYDKRHRLFKYPLDTDVIAPTYCKYMLHENDQVYAIKFGASENYLYLFEKSYTYDKLMISRLQSSDLSPVWSYGFTNYNIDFQYQAFDLKDMGLGKEIIAIYTQQGSAYFGRLIVENGIVTSSDLFTKLNIGTQSLRGVRIINEEKLVACFYSSGTGIYLETVQFGIILNLSIKKTISIVSSQSIYIGKFISDTNYIALSVGKEILMTSGSTLTNNFKSTFSQGIIYSTEQSLTCQTLSTESPAIHALTKTINGIENLALSTYPIFIEISYFPVILATDTALVAVALSTAKLVYDDNFCLSLKYASNVNSGNQIVTSYFTAGSEFVKTIILPKLFYQCSADPISMTYTMTNSDFTQLNSMIVFDENAKTITVSAASLMITYRIALKATIVDSSDYIVQSFYLVGQNNAPNFVGISNTTYYGQNMALNSVVNYKYPYLVQDQEGNQPITVTASSLYALKGNLFKIIFENGYVELTLNPVLFIDVGSQFTMIRLADQYTSRTYYYLFNVTNSAPTFDSVLKDQTVAVNSVITYVLPGYSDPEGHIATVTAAFLSDGITPSPKFITLDQATNTFTISPTLISSVGSLNVQVLIFDGQPAKTTYTFQVTVTNTAPVFNPTTLIDQSLRLYFSIDYTPSAYDAEGNSLVVETIEILPSFITIIGAKIIFSPTQLSEVGTITVSIKVSDTLLSSDIQSFTVTVLPNLPASFSTSLLDLTVALNSQLKSTLPSYSDPEGSAVTFVIEPENLGFITIVGDEFTFAPTTFASTGIHTITVILNDGSQKSSYPFKLTVTNSAPVMKVATISQSVALNSVIQYSLSGITDAEGHTITIVAKERPTGVLPVYITIEQSTFKFSPTQFSQVGAHIIDIILSDGQLSSSTYTFTLTVTNSAPILNDATIDQTVALNSKYSYALTGFTDAEGNTITMSAIKRATISLPSFIVISQLNFTISPNQFSQTGEHIIDFILSDSQLNSPTYSFKVTVTNSAPKLNTPFVSQFVALNSKFSYSLAGFTDPEGHTITIYAVKTLTTSLPSFIVFTNPTFTISPTLFSQTGSHIIDVTLSDGQLSSPIYSFTVTVTNSAPIFSILPTSQTLAMNQIKTYKLTDFADAEGHSITISAIEQGKLILPAFVTFSSPIFKINPNQFSFIGKSIIEIKLTDGQLNSIYTIDVTVTNSAPIFDSLHPSNQVVAMNSIFNYVLPVYSDPEGSMVTLKMTASPSFASLQPGGIIKFAPVSFSDVMAHNIDIILQDGQPLTSPIYSFTVTVTNSAPIFTKGNIQNQVISIKSIYNYPLPAYHDREGNLITVSISPSSSFVHISSDQLILTFYAISFADIGTHRLKLTLSDGQPMTSEYFFDVTFQNNPPIFTESQPQHQTVRLNDDFRYKLPLFKDPEGINAYLQISTKASFITLIDVDVIKINPTEFQSIGVHSVYISLYDDEPKTSYYEILITVTNTPPKFIGLIPKDQEIHLNEVREYDLPAIFDLENNVVTIVNALPPFVEFKETKYTISPTALSHIGTFKVQGSLRDQVSETLFSFNIKVINDPPYFTSDPVDQTVQVGQTITYALPSTGDRENLPVKVSLTLAGKKPLPNFMSYSKNILKVNPISNLFHVGVFTLLASLSDGEASPKFYQFKLKSTKASIQFGNDNTLVKTSNSKSIQDIIASLTKAQDGSSQKIEIFKAIIKIAAATRDGHIKIQINSKQDISGIVKTIEQGDLQFRLITQGKTIVNCTIKSKDHNKGQFKVFLQFASPTDISSSNDLDQIEMTLLNDVISLTGRTIMILPAMQTSRIYLPPQLSESSAKLVEKFKSGTNLAAVMALPGGVIINLTLSMFIQYLWAMLNDLSFLTILTMISMTLPGIVQIISQAMLNFIYLDLLMTEKWLVPIFFSEQKEADIGAPLNQQFDENGFSSTILIKNLGSTFVYLIMIIGSYPLYYLLAFLARFSQRIAKYRDKFAAKLFWGTPIRFIIQQFPPLFLAAFVNLYGMSFETFGTTLSSTMSIMIVGATPILLIIITVVIYKVRTSQRLNEDFKKKFSPISDGLNPEAGFIGAYWNIIVLIRWVLTSIVIVTFRDYPQFQVVSMLAMSIFAQVLIIGGKPMEGQGENIISFLNEFMVSVYLYITIILTDFMGTNQFRDTCGWALAGIVVFSTICNLLKFKITVIKVSIRLCKIRNQKIIVARNYQIHQELEKAREKLIEKQQFNDISIAQDLKLKQEKQHLEYLSNIQYYGSTHKTFIERSKAFQANNHNLTFNQERLELINNRKMQANQETIYCNQAYFILKWIHFLCKLSDSKQHQYSRMICK